MALVVPALAGALAGWWFLREGENHFDEWLSIKVRARWFTAAASTLVLGAMIGAVAGLLAPDWPGWPAAPPASGGSRTSDPTRSAWHCMWPLKWGSASSSVTRQDPGWNASRNCARLTWTAARQAADATAASRRGPTPSAVSAAASAAISPLRAALGGPLLREGRARALLVIAELVEEHRRGEDHQQHHRRDHQPGNRPEENQPRFLVFHRPDQHHDAQHHPGRREQRRQPQVAHVELEDEERAQDRDDEQPEQGVGQPRGISCRLAGRLPVRWPLPDSVGGFMFSSLRERPHKLGPCA